MRIHKSQSLLALFIVPILVFSSLGQTAPQPNLEDMKRYWQALVPSIPSVLKHAFPNERIEENYQVRIVETADITAMTSLKPWCTWVKAALTPIM